MLSHEVNSKFPSKARHAVYTLARVFVFLLTWGRDVYKGILRGSHYKGPTKIAEQIRVSVHRPISPFAVIECAPYQVYLFARHMTSVSPMTHNCLQTIIQAGVFCQRWISFHHIQLECTAAALG